MHNENILEKMKRNLLYDGLESKEDYYSLLPKLNESNRKNIILIGWINSAVMLALFFASFLVEGIGSNKILYLCCSIVSLFVSFGMCTIGKKYSWTITLGGYIILTVMYGFGMVSGSVNDVTAPAVSFCALLILCPLLFHDSAIRSISYRIIIVSIFCVLSYKYKSNDLFLTDVVDAIAYGVLGTLIGRVKQKNNTSTYYLKNNIEKEVEKKTSQLEGLTLETITALANAIDAKDKYTKGHSTRVAKYSRMIAERLNYSNKDLDNLYYIAILHDVGKIGVPDEIINKKGKLTDEEYAIIKEHPKIGYDILKDIDIIPGIELGAHYHHERYDGRGYPDGLSGNDIPKIARIIAVADAYDAMTSNRSYRGYMAQDKVKEEVEKGRGTQFDPEFADIMLSIIEQDKDYILHE